MRKMLYVALALMIAAPTASAADLYPSDLGLPEVGSDGWLEDAIDLALDVTFDVLGITLTAAAGLCNAATDKCPI